MISTWHCGDGFAITHLILVCQQALGSCVFLTFGKKFNLTYLLVSIRSLWHSYSYMRDRSLKWENACIRSDYRQDYTVLSWLVTDGRPQPLIGDTTLALGPVKMQPDQATRRKPVSSTHYSTDSASASASRFLSYLFSIMNFYMEVWVKHTPFSASCF